ncbi:ABC transporter permease [Rhodococcus jostii]|uniref:Putative spermidine/putrescine transport system permease protein n=1 Tax=Rhodococcus jostii TaxID=132919 RepID=A0A1H4JAA8_RHOJO|nr:ABC transporter permease [Rhodococcus jostii]SEB42926.1 putative spermidine/putrescine transport system permease protein [Rhodococcus jostii]
MRETNHSAATKSGAVALDIIAVLAIIFLLLPLLIIIPMSFSSSLTLEFPPPNWSVANYQEFFTSVEWRRATIHTFEVGVLAMILAVAVATPTAYAINISRIRGRGVVQLLVMLPLVVPLIVVAVAAYGYFAPRGLSDSIVGLALVQGMLGVPLAFLAINASFDQFDKAQLVAAQSLGAKPWVAFARVVYPSIRPGIVTGGLFAFVFSFNEVVTAIFLGGPQSETLPKRMWDGILLQVDPIIAVVSTVMILFTVLLMGAALGARRLSKRVRA